MTTTPQLTLRFTHMRRPTCLDDLPKTLLAQLAVAGRLYDGVTTPGQARLPEPDAQDEPEEGGPLWEPELWDVVDEQDELRYHLWLYGVDSGTLFVAHQVEIAGEVIQFGFEPRDEGALGAALKDAQRRAKAQAPKPGEPGARHTLWGVDFA